MEEKIKELMLKYFNQKVLTSELDIVDECVTDVIKHLKSKDTYDIVKWTESNCLRFADYQLMSGLEKIKNEYLNKN